MDSEDNAILTATLVIYRGILIIAIIGLAVFILVVYQSDKAKSAQITQDEARISALESKLGRYDELKEQMTNLDKNLDQLEGLLNPEKRFQPTPGSIQPEANLADGLYKVDMIEPKDCDSPLPLQTVVVCIQSIALSTASNETTLHISIGSTEETQIDTGFFTSNCYLQDETGERPGLKSIGVGHQSSEGATPLLIHKSETIYTTFVFNQRVDGRARQFQLFWPGNPQGTTIHFGLLPFS